MAWPTEQDTFLRLNAGALPVSVIARKLGRTEKAVRNYAGKRNIKVATGIRLKGGFNFRTIRGAVSGDTANDPDLVAAFLASREPTRCPPMPAAGAVTPQYIGRGW